MNVKHSLEILANQEKSHKALMHSKNHVLFLLSLLFFFFFAYLHRSLEVWGGGRLYSNVLFISLCLLKFFTTL